MITFVHENLLNSDAEYICHQVNCQGKMNSGVAKAIRERWPIVYTTYKRVCEEEIPIDEPQHNMLGNILFVNVNDYKPTTWPQAPVIVNMFAQEHYGYDGRRYTSYDAFWSCLGHIREAVPKGSKIAFPYKIGSDRGGANWDVIYAMVAAALGSDYNVEFYYLEVDEWLKHHLDIDWEGK